MRLVVGLGNPGAQYEHNRHNIGFLALNRVAVKYGLPSWKKQFQSEWAETRFSPEHRIALLKPQTFMNLSGNAVATAAGFYKIPPETVIVLHDELDLPPGRLRVKQGGGSGGHNGLRSIDAHLGENYWRVRIGIGHPGDKDMVSHYVLSDFSRAEREIQDKMLTAIADYFPLLVAGDAAGFMNKIALDVRVESSEPHGL